MIKTKCQSCQSEIQIGVRPEMGLIVHCPECKTALEVVWLFPIELDFVVDPLLQPDLPEAIDHP